jgi:glutathione S-transferase
LEKGLQWETTWLDLPSGEHKKPEYLAINPVGKVPALIDDGVIVHDSTIINEYLEDTRPQRQLLPRDPVKRARARAFEDYADAYLMPSLFKIFWQMRKPEGERDRDQIAEGEREARDHFAYLERELQGREYFAGEFSLADISFIPPLANLERAGFSIPDDFRNVKAWWQRVKERPSFKASWPDD